MSGIGSIPSFDGWRDDFLADYGGSDRKTGLIDPEGSRWMAKYYVNNAVPEYMASHVLGIAGFDVHETRLGTLDGEVVAACRNFVPEDGKLIEFGTFMRRRYSSSGIGRIADIGQICETLETDPVLSPKADEFKARFWELFIGDALIGNYDRRGEHFGFLVNEDGEAFMSPAYDNGNSLYPNLFEEDMKAVLANPKEIAARVLVFPDAALKLKEKRTGYKALMFSGLYGELTEAAISVIPRIKRAMPEIRKFIDRQAFLSKIRRDFYKTMLAVRMNLILEPAYAACASRRFDLETRKRLLEGIGYSEKDFNAEWERGGAVLTRKINGIRKSFAPKGESGKP